MKLFSIARTNRGGYDTYDSAVVAARTKTEAQKIHPDGGAGEWGKDLIRESTWVKVNDVSVEYIGQAARGTKAGVICASFNAG
jgi:hypothetical protein